MAKTQKNEFNISGKVLFVGMPIFISDTFSKRILVLEAWVYGRYKQEVPFDFRNENMDLLNNIRINDWVNVDFVLRGNKKIQGNGKAVWYNSNEGVSCTKED